MGGWRGGRDEGMEGGGGADREGLRIRGAFNYTSAMISRYKELNPFLSRGGGGG